LAQGEKGVDVFVSQRPTVDFSGTLVTLKEGDGFILSAVLHGAPHTFSASAVRLVRAVAV